jgi:hypothetical protein
MASRTEYIEEQSIAELRPGDMLWDSQLKRFGARCRPRATTYLIKARIDGHQRWITLGQHGTLTPSGARTQAERMLAEIDSGRDPRKPSSITRWRKRSDPLDEPIIRPDALVVALVAFGYPHSPAAQAAVRKKAEDFILEEKARKLLLLLAQMGIDPATARSPIAWFDLSVCLAEKFIEGFKVVDVPARRRGAPKKDYFELVKAVERRKILHDKTAMKACRALASQQGGQWHGRRPKTLQSRYHEGLRNFRRPLEEDHLLGELRKAAEEALKAAPASQGNPPRTMS